MVIREQRQEEAANAWENSNRKQICYCAPRMGKTRVALKILKNNPKYKNILLLYPRVEIKSGWEYIIQSTPDIKWNFITTKSVKNITNRKFDLIIWDECHEASPNQLNEIGKLTKNIDTLGLTGTLTLKTRQEIFLSTFVDVCYEYSIKQGVEEGILADYEIFIHTIKLKPIENSTFKKFSFLKAKLKGEGKQHGWIDLKLINLLQNSETKKQKTIQLLEESRADRVLVFCGVTKIADELGIPVYHSKNNEKQILEDFCTGKGEKLATVNMLASGISILPISRGIVNYISGNPEDGAQKLCRMLNWEYDTPDKKAHLDIVCSDTEFEKGRIKTALQFFENNKIHWI